MKIVLFLAAAAMTVGLVGLGFVSARMTVPAPGGPAGVPAEAPTPAALAARLDAVETRLRTLELARPRDEQPARADRDDRYLIALLHLQDVTRTARPWPRELQLVLDLAGPDRLKPALVEVLRTHAAQGIPTRPELRRGFVAARGVLLAEATTEGGMIQGLLHGGQAAAAGLGLVAPPPPGRTEAVLAGIDRRLDRGDLAGALHEAALLDSPLQPRVAEWSAQVRARLAVEQAIQELLVQSLAAGPRRP